MSFVTDIRAVSDGAIEQIADRFADLPRPLLAAIGAGDLAVEQWAALRESIIEQLSNGGSRRVAAVTFTTDLPARAQQAATEYAGKAQQAATDYVGKAQQVVIELPAKAQQVAGGLGNAQQVAADLPLRAQTVAAQVARSIGAFASQMPAKAQELLAELPETIAEFSGDLTVESVRDTMDAYTELVGSIYGSLADRGERTWSRVRSSPLRPGTVVDAAPDASLKSGRGVAKGTNRPSRGAVAIGAEAPAQDGGVGSRSPVDTKVTTAAPKAARAARSATPKTPSKAAPKAGNDSKIATPSGARTSRAASSRAATSGAVTSRRATSRAATSGTGKDGATRSAATTHASKKQDATTKDPAAPPTPSSAKARTVKPAASNGTARSAKSSPQQG
jgi:hypothetical protein